MRRMYDMPEEITLPGGQTLKPVIGGTLNGQPFLSKLAACTNKNIIEKAKRDKLKYRVIGVLSRNLRGKLDLHGRPYSPSVWVFVEVQP